MSYTFSLYFPLIFHTRFNNQNKTRVIISPRLLLKQMAYLKKYIVWAIRDNGKNEALVF